MKGRALPESLKHATLESHGWAPHTLQQNVLGGKTLTSLSTTAPSTGRFPEAEAMASRCAAIQEEKPKALLCSGRYSRLGGSGGLWLRG